MKRKNDVMAQAFRLAERREKIFRHKQACPICDTDQVQMVEFDDEDPVVQYRCRHCRHYFSKSIPIR